MKAISIKQPWASLICTPREDNPNLGIKDIENRSWKLPEKYKGQRVLIHASAKPESDICVRLQNNSIIRIANIANYKTWFEISEMPTGAIIGSVELIDCVINHSSIWAEKSCEDLITYNWVLANPILFQEPIPAKGKLSFWNYG